MSGDFGNLFEAFNLSLDDPTWKVLPAALQIYGIRDKSWQSYAMLICYGPPDNRIERCLNFDERPFLVFKELKNARRDPVFMLKHMRDIRPPIATAHKTATGTVAGTTPDTSNNDDGQSHSLADELKQLREAELKETTHDSSGVAYAIAIYPYLAEKSNELNVMVGDTFMIVSQSQERWVVQEDPTGFGVVENDPGKHFEVPAGCLLKIKVPVATAVAEMRGESSTAFIPTTPLLRMAILPLSSISTNIPAVALVDYKKQGDDEIGLKKGDTLRIFKSYNHWVYVERDGDRGWVPEESVALSKGSG